MTPKPEESTWYFRDLLGMEVVHTEGQSAFLRGWGDYATWTLKLTENDQPDVGSFRTVSPQALERRAKAIKETGLGIGWANGDYGHGRCYRFRDPDGHYLGIYYEKEEYDPPA